MDASDPEELIAESAPAYAEIPADTTMGAVHLTVADLRRSVDFYRDAIGLGVLDEGSGRATLGVDSELVVLVEERGARPPGGHTGLFHLALLLPQRTDLAHWLAHAARDRIALTGLSDHFVSEAIYLRDPDGHGIEIYWDRPRQVWEGQVAQRMTTEPLDVDDLLGPLEDQPAASFTGLPRGTRMGHVHLKVSAIAETVAFYRDVLGLGVMAELGTQAAFLGAGGYHHHIGANTWQSARASAPPPGSAALRHATLVFATTTGRDEAVARVADSGGKVEDTDWGPAVRDPSANALVLAVAD